MGPASRYRIVAADARRFVSRVDPEIVELDEGAVRRVTVWMYVPAGTVPGTSVDLVVTATSEGTRPTSNSAIRKLRVSDR